MEFDDRRTDGEILRYILAYVYPDISDNDYNVLKLFELRIFDCLINLKRSAKHIKKTVLYESNYRRETYDYLNVIPDNSLSLKTSWRNIN